MLLPTGSCCTSSSERLTYFNTLSPYRAFSESRELFKSPATGEERPRELITARSGLLLFSISPCVSGHLRRGRCVLRGRRASPGHLVAMGFFIGIYGSRYFFKWLLGLYLVVDRVLCVSNARRFWFFLVLNTRCGPRAQFGECE